MVRLLIAATLLIALSPSAEAQIYTWRDAKGTLVLSDRPMATGARIVSVPGAPSVRTTRAAVETHVGRYDSLIDRNALQFGVRADLVRAVIQVESGFNPAARSPKGAMGLMQLMPATAAELGVNDPYDPAQNIEGGVAYLHRLLTQYNGDEELALAAYNAGPEAVSRYGNQVPPYRETQNYVEKIKLTTDLGKAGQPPLTHAVTVETSSDHIYRSFDIVKGRRIPRYSNVRPRSGDYEVVP